MIQVIARAFRIMEELSLDGEVSLEALVRVSNLNKGTLCNILRTLIELSCVRRTRAGHYQLGNKLRELAEDNGIPPETLAVMRAAAEDLAAETGESGVVGVLRRGRVAIAAQVQCQRSLMVNTREVYAALSLYGSVTGRILLAFLAPEERAALLRASGCPGAVWGDAETPEAVEELCAQVRADRLSVMENPGAGIIAFAAPAAWGQRTVSLGLTMPLCRCAAPEREGILEKLRDNADRLAAALH